MVDCGGDTAIGAGQGVGVFGECGGRVMGRLPGSTRNRQREGGGWGPPPSDACRQIGGNLSSGAAEAVGRSSVRVTYQPAGDSCEQSRADRDVRAEAEVRGCEAERVSGICLIGEPRRDIAEQRC